MTGYIIPENARHIRDISKGKPAYYLAGGTDLMVMKKDNLIDGRRWIDISALNELKGIEEKPGRVEIGALSTMNEIVSSDIISEKAPALSDAASQMGSPLIRNLATIGGNFANSNPAGDIIPPVCALDGDLVLLQGENKRSVQADEFCTGPGENILREGEIIYKIRIPLKENSFCGFMKLAARRALAISKVSLAAGWVMKEERIEKIKIAMGAVGPKVLRARRTEMLLKGEKITPDIMERASRIIIHETAPIDDFRSTADYRGKMTAVLLKRIFLNG